jgi:hypothetical protein
VQYKHRLAARTLELLTVTPKSQGVVMQHITFRRKHIQEGLDKRHLIGTHGSISPPGAPSPFKEARTGHKFQEGVAVAAPVTQTVGVRHWYARMRCYFQRFSGRRHHTNDAQVALRVAA